MCRHFKPWWSTSEKLERIRYSKVFNDETWLPWYGSTGDILYQYMTSADRLIFPSSTHKYRLPGHQNTLSWKTQIVRSFQSSKVQQQTWKTVDPSALSLQIKLFPCVLIAFINPASYSHGTSLGISPLATKLLETSAQIILCCKNRSLCALQSLSAAIACAEHKASASGPYC